VKLVHLVAFIIKKFVVMHGHTNVKWRYISEDNITFIVTAIRTSDFMYSKFARHLFCADPQWDV